MKRCWLICLLWLSISIVPCVACASLSCETSSGAVVTFRGAMSEVEFFRSTYNWGELKAALYGGMKLHAYARERDLDWAVLTVKPGPRTYWGGTTRAVLTFADGERIESVDMACTDSPLEHTLYTLDGGLWLAGPHVARVQSGGVLVMAGFPRGSLIEEHGEYWADDFGPIKMEVLE